MTRQMSHVLSKACVIKDWVEENCETVPDWKTRLIETKLDGLLEVIDARDRRSVERRS